MSCSEFLRLDCSDPQTDSSLFADMVCIWDFCCSPFEVVPHAVRQSVERRCALRQRGEVRGLLEGLFSLIVGVLQPDALVRLLLMPGVPSPARSWVLPLRAGPFSPTSLFLLFLALVSIDRSSQLQLSFLMVVRKQVYLHTL
jgi:hypothetical protein